MSANATAQVEVLSETVSLLTEMSRVLAIALADCDEILDREAAGEIDPAEALATMRVIMERHYGEDGEGGTSH